MKQLIKVITLNVFLLGSISAYAQEKHYFVADYGTIINDGSNSDAYRSHYQHTNYTLSETTDAKHQGNLARLAYGYRFNEKVFFEVGHSNLGEVTYKHSNRYFNGTKETYDDTDQAIKEGGYIGTPCGIYQKCDNISSFHKYTVSAVDFSAIYQHRLNDKIDLLVRAGITTHEWEIGNGSLLNFSPSTNILMGSKSFLLGFGADIGKIRMEYRLYDIPLFLCENQIYDKVGILSVGYKFEF